MKSYGITQYNKDQNWSKEAINVREVGYAIIPDLISKSECEKYNLQLNEIYQVQTKEVGIENLKKINEENLVRMPFIYNKDFYSLFTNEKINQVVSELLGSFYQVHLQNAILNQPNEEHHQSSWHRDLPYQNWSSSEPLGVNAFYCLTEFNSKNGATSFVPGSHKKSEVPTLDFLNDNKIQIEAPQGSVILFDSMLYHKAEFNQSQKTRIGVNNMFVRPFIKQQINIPSALDIDLKELSIQEKMLLGYDFKLSNNVVEYRNNKLNKTL